MTEKIIEIVDDWEMECPVCHFELDYNDIGEEAEIFVNEGNLNNKNEGSIWYECPACGVKFQIEFNVEQILEFSFTRIKIQ